MESRSCRCLALTWPRKQCPLSQWRSPEADRPLTPNCRHPRPCYPDLMKWTVIGSFGAGLGVAVAGFAMVPQSNTDAQHRATCAASGGVPHSYGTGGRWWFCDQPLSDAGKVCTAASECIGQCTLPDDYHWVRGEKPHKVGACQARTRVGCMTILQNGLPTQLCID